VNQFFLGFAGFFASYFSEKWKYLPIALGRICRRRKILPGGKLRTAIVARRDFPPQRKIDV
jgi:hypothetical protein